MSSPHCIIEYNLVQQPFLGDVWTIMLAFLHIHLDNKYDNVLSFQVEDTMGDYYRIFVSLVVY